MKKRIAMFFFLFACTFFFVAYGQLCDNDEEIRKFLRQAENLPEDRTFKVSLYAVELLNSSATLNQHWGIFKIGMFIEHTATHFLLVNEGKRLYVNSNEDTANILDTILDFLDASSCTEVEKLSYIRKVVSVCIQNLEGFEEL